MASVLFVPHAGKPAKRTDESVLKTTHVAATPEPVPLVTVTTEFRLPPHLAFESIIQEASAFHRVDPALVRAVVRVESAFDPLAVSSAGAQGLMQLMPALSEELGVSDPFDPRENVFAGVRYLRWLLDEHDGDERLALASYNAGPGAVEEHAGVPPFKETQHYVKTITGLLARERGPVAATDER